MFVIVGRFRFRPLDRDVEQNLMHRMEEDLPSIARASPGFRGLNLVRLGDDELMTVWLWDSEGDWDAAQPHFGPSLQEYIVPNLAQPPDRLGVKSSFRLRPELVASGRGEVDARKSPDVYTGVTGQL